MLVYIAHIGFCDPLKVHLIAPRRFDSEYGKWQKRACIVVDGVERAIPSEDRISMTTLLNEINQAKELVLLRNQGLYQHALLNQMNISFGGSDSAEIEKAFGWILGRHDFDFEPEQFTSQNSKGGLAQSFHCRINKFKDSFAFQVTSVTLCIDYPELYFNVWIGNENKKDFHTERSLSIIMNQPLISIGNLKLIYDNLIARAKTKALHIKQLG